MAQKIIKLDKTKETKTESKSKKKIDGKAMLNNFKSTCLSLFHSFLFFGFCYVLILMFTILIPSILAYVLGSLGFESADANGAVLIVSLASALFLTAWIFICCFFVVRFVWKIYKRNMKKSLSQNTLDKLRELYH